jgi:hypothetical protein
LPEQLLLSAFGSLPGAAMRVRDRADARPVRAAFERADVEPGLGEHALDHLDVRRLAVVRRAGDRELLVVEVEAIGGAAFDQRDRLQQLDGGARKDRAIDVAERDQALAVGVEDGDRRRDAPTRACRRASPRRGPDWGRDRRSWRHCSRPSRQRSSPRAVVARRSTIALRSDAAATARPARADHNRRRMSAAALALVLAAALLHALWNVVAKKTGGDARFALMAALLLVVVWAPLGLWFGWQALPAWGAVEWAVLLASADRPRRLLHDPAARLPARRPHRRLPGRARHRAAARLARRGRPGSASG